LRPTIALPYPNLPQVRNCEGSLAGKELARQDRLANSLTGKISQIPSLEMRVHEQGSRAGSLTGKNPSMSA
jgi:hypothetical protein